MTMSTIKQRGLMNMSISRWSQLKKEIQSSKHKHNENNDKVAKVESENEKGKANAKEELLAVPVA